ncbi:MAG: hypothetical protein HY270_21910 [Deltaproteobacteria bacterium]|nr:hypothetical protein [Deltaproteobacteria bacterium]
MRNVWWVRSGAVVLATLLSVLPGCLTPIEWGAVGGGAATLLAAFPAAQEIEQIYYLGSFDPQGQLPPEFYRVTVRGQASLMSQMQFGSGWVKAEVLDSLSSHFKSEKSGEVTASGTDSTVDLGARGRRLVLFGPEGFREAPRDHRLVIVMGSSPEAFFQAMDQSLGIVARVQEMQRGSAVTQAIFGEYTRITQELEQLQDIRLDAETGILSQSGGAQ